MRKLKNPQIVMQARCKTCPFNENGDPFIRDSVRARIMIDGSQLCHSTGWPQATHLCRGARDEQLWMFYRIGFLRAPIDEAWDEAWRQILEKRLRQSDPR